MSGMSGSKQVSVEVTTNHYRRRAIHSCTVSVVQESGEGKLGVLVSTGKHIIARRRRRVSTAKVSLSAGHAAREDVGGGNDQVDDGTSRRSSVPLVVVDDRPCGV